MFKRPIPAFLLLILLCTACSLTRPNDSGRLVQVVLEDNGLIRTDASVLSAPEGSDVQFRITPGQNITVRGTDYRDCSLEPQEDGSFLCTLRDVRYDTVVTVLAEEDPYTILYDANGGAPVSDQYGTFPVFSYSAKHLRVNTEQGTNLFTREGFTLTGWNTSADGSGDQIGLGSRVKADRNEPLTLYAEWAAWNDSSDFLYEKRQSSVTITGFADKEAASGGSVVIPAEIDGLPVTEIAEGAFADVDCGRVVLPPSVRTVAVHSFDRCALSELVLFDTLQEITDYAFEGCANLRTIRINACVPPVYSGSYYDTFPDKCDRLTALNEAASSEDPAAGRKSSAKIVLFSGSSTRFGYDSAALDDAFPGYAVVNMGVFAYTNALPQLDLILRHTQAGDILIHSPEFDAAKRQFCTTNAFDDKFFNMIEGNYDLLAELDYRDYSGVLTAFSTFQKTRRGMEAGSYALSASDFDEDGNPVSSPSYNEYGDYIVYRPDSTDDAPIYDLPLAYTAASFPPKTYIEPLNEVYDRFAEKGIRVLFTYAPRNEAALSEESTPQERAKLDALLRESLHAEVISDLEDSLYPGRYLYGTDNHLSTAGVAIRTERIRRDLEAVLQEADN